MLQLFTWVRWFNDAINNLLSLYVSSYIFRDGLIDSLITQFDLFLPSITFEMIAFIQVPRNSDRSFTDSAQKRVLCTLIEEIVYTIKGIFYY